MTGLWITLAVIAGLILLILLLLFFGRAGIRITCTKKPKVTLSVLGIRFTLISDKDKEKKQRLKHCKNPKRALRRELRRLQRQAEKDEKKKRKAAAKAAKKAQKKQQKKEYAKTHPTPNLVENLSMITALIKKLYRVTQGKLDIHVKRLHLYVATGDAAKTAVMYGVVLQSASYLLQWIDTHFTHIRRDEGDMEVVADYLSPSSHAEIDIVCSIYLSQALGIGVKMLNAYRKEKALAVRKAKKRAG